MSYRKNWPKDRIERLRILKGKARKAGIALDVKNHGPRGFPVYMVHATAQDGDQTFPDLDAAEKWIAGLFPV